MKKNISLTIPALLASLILTFSSCDFLATPPAGNADNTIQQESWQQSGKTASDSKAGNADGKTKTDAFDKTSKSDSDRKNVRYELPAEIRGELRIEHTGYALSYNKTHNTPNWAAWVLTAKRTEGTIERSTKFWADPQVPKPYRVEWYEYKESGYDRGHMCPAGDMRWSEQAMHDCFYMSNMAPQTGALNSGAWNKLEMRCRDWARQEGKIYIVCGPYYDKKKKHLQIGIDHRIDVPEGFFKAVMSLRRGHEKAIAFFYQNDDSNQSYRSAAMSVDDLEKIIKLDLFPMVDDKIENRIEATFSLDDFNNS